MCFKFWLRVEVAIIQEKMCIAAEEMINTLLAQIPCPCIIYEKKKSWTLLHCHPRTLLKKRLHSEKTESKDQYMAQNSSLFTICIIQGKRKQHCFYEKHISIECKSLVVIKGSYPQLHEL